MTASIKHLSPAQEADPILDDLLADFANKVQAGEPIDPEAYIRAHPERAEQLRRMLPAIQILADLERSASAGDTFAAPPGAELRTGLGELGDYRILREIGRGGMGVVYEAEQISLGRRVALKVLPFAAALDARQRQRFQNEAQAAAQLHHTNIVPVHAFGCERGVHFYAMQFIEGQSLAAAILQLRQTVGLDPFDPDETGPEQPAKPVRGPAAPATMAPTRSLADLSTERPLQSLAYFRTVAQLGGQAAEALEHAHEQGVVHRDIKPANLLLDSRGQLWVTDFGLARFHSHAGLTQTGDILGTLRYMSPEQALARHGLVDHRTDVYALGITLYELLTLQPAFNGRDRQEILRQIEREEPRPPRWLNPAMPKDLETIVLKAMSKEVASRYATARELADDLRRFLDHEPIQARRPSLGERARKWVWRHPAEVVAVLAVLIVAVAALAASTVLISGAKARAEQEKARAEREKEQAESAQKQAEEEKRRAEEEKKRAEQERTRTEEALEMVLNLMDHYGMPLLIGRHYDDQKPVDPETLEGLKKLFLYFEERVQKDDKDPAQRPKTDHEVLKQRQKFVRYCKELGYLLHYTDRAAAERAYRQALALQIKLVDDFPKEPNFRYHLASIYHQLGLLLHETYRFPEAETAFLKALTQEEKLAADHPKVPKCRAALAGTRLHLGRLLFREMKRFEDAETHYRRALDLFAKLVADHPTVSEDLLGLRRTLRDITDLARHPGRSSFADEAHGQCLDLLEKISAGLSTLATKGAKKELAGAVDYLAWVLATSQGLSPRDASRVIACAGRAVGQEPGVEFYSNTVGAALHRAGQWKAAAEALHRSLERKPQGDSQDGFFLAMAYWQLGDKPKAHQWFVKSVQWRVEQNPHHVEWQRFQREAVELGVATSAEGLVLRLCEDKNPAVRLEACRILQAVGTEQSLPALGEVAAKDGDTGVRQAAQDAIKAINSRK